MGLTRLAIRFAAPVPKPDSFKRYLFIGPHPDDIEIGAGASIARLAAEGKEICFLICTDGRFGTDNRKDLTPEELIGLRREETIKSAALLGVNDVRFLSLSDGAFYTQEELLQGILSVISDFRPDVIFCPDPSVTSECHPDHLNCGLAARTAAQISGNPGIMTARSLQPADVQALAFYMTAKPNRFIKTTGHLEKQFDSIFTCHLSQYPPDCPDASTVKLYLKLRAIEYGLRSGHKTAEGFRVLGRTHMHCLPEAGN